jgi:putative transposase
VRTKDLDDAYLSDTIVDIWTMSRRSYASPRVHAELKLGQDMRCLRKRVERLMRQARIAGIHPAQETGMHQAGSLPRVLRRPGPTALRSHRAGPSVGHGVTEHPTENGKGVGSEFG